MKIATWNVNCWNPARRFHKVKLLELEPWDVALLQEVGPETFEAFVDGTGFSGVSAIDLVGGPWAKRSHGVAILVRPPWSITDAAVLPTDDAGTEPDNWLRARAISATITGPGHQMTVASVHTLNAAGKGEERERKIAEKMAHYRSIASWAVAAPRPLIVGMDVNGWEDWAAEREVDPVDAFADQRRFLGVGADHGLRDVLVDHLLHNRPDLLERRRALGAEGEDGSLEVTYQRSANNYPRTNRMDRIFASAELRVTDVRTLYSDALTVGSDHALVIAELSWPGSDSSA